MSIEIIKERIRMIESNDFSLANDTLNEAISGSEKDIRPLFEPKIKTNLIDKIKSKLGFDRNHTTLNAIGTSDKNSKDIQSMVDRRLRNTYVNVNDSNVYLDIPKKDKNIIFNIYKTIKNKNINISDLDSNYNPKIGYVKTGSNDNILSLKNSDLIQIYYDDENLTNLKSMVIFNKNNRYSNKSFSDLANELNNNKKNYKINTVSFNTKQIEISF
jgi:hypothetical protein